MFSTGKGPTLRNVTTQLTTYTGEAIEILGQIEVTVQYKIQEKKLALLVVAGEGPSLLGHDWLTHLKLDWSQLNHIQSSTSNCQPILNKHKSIFEKGLGTIKGVTAKFHVDPKIQPKFYKEGPVLYALQPKVEAALRKLEEDGVIKPVQFSKWAAPIVPIVKPDGSVHICGDYRVTLNCAANTVTYPLPKIEDLFASLSGEKLFLKMDLASAYLQIPLEEQSKEYTTINTHKGLYCYNRLPFGVASAPSIFQRTMENLFKGINHVCVYLDDILVTGTTKQEHLQNLDAVLSRLESAGMRLKYDKCAFLLPAVESLGHKISAQGLQPTDFKVQAIKNAPAPTNVS